VRPECDQVCSTYRSNTICVGTPTCCTSLPSVVPHIQFCVFSHSSASISISGHPSLTCSESKHLNRARKTPFSGKVWLVAWDSFNAHDRKCTHQERNSQLRHIKKEETASDCPATMPLGPGTPPFSRACCQQHSVPQLHQSQPLQFIVALRPVSAAHPGGTSSLAANRMPFHYTAALLYAATNIAGENPVADKTKHGILATALGDCTT